MQWIDEDWVSLASSTHFFSDNDMSFSFDKAIQVEEDSLLGENKSFSSASSSLASSTEVKVKITFKNYREGNCRYHGPRLGSPSQPAWPSPRAPLGLGPKASRPKNVRSILRPGTPKGLGTKASRSRNARSILRPGVRVPLIPDVFLPRCFLSRSETPPNETANRLFMI